MKTKKKHTARIAGVRALPSISCTVRHTLVHVAKARGIVLDFVACPIVLQVGGRIVGRDCLECHVHDIYSCTRCKVSRSVDEHSYLYNNKSKHKHSAAFVVFDSPYA